MFGFLKGLFEKGPLAKLEKLTAGQLEQRQSELEYEIQASVEEGKRKQAQLEQEMLKGAEADEWDIDRISSNCAMMQDEIKGIKNDMMGLQKMKSVVHVIYLLKRSKVGLIKEARVGLQDMIGASSMEELTVAVNSLRTTMGAEAGELNQMAQEMEPAKKVEEVTTSKSAESFKEQIVKMKAVASPEQREQIAKEKTREMLSE